MGQISTKEEAIEKENIYASYPGLEQQLDMVFACHDIHKKGKLSYSTIEMLLRHFLMQCGFMEYVCRFVDSDGKLDLKYVENYINKKLLYKIKCCCDSMLTLEEMKSLVIIFLKKISDTYAEDQNSWMEKMRTSEEEKGKALKEAMSEYEKNILFTHALKEQQIHFNNTKLNEWNETIENAYEAQQEILRQFDIKQKEREKLTLLKRTELEIASEYIQKIKEAAINNNQNNQNNKLDNSKCFLYPASSAPSGACTSAGAILPHRRYKEIKQKKIYSLCL